MSRGRAGAAAAVFVIAGLASLPGVWPGYHLDLLTVIFYWIALSGCWNLMSGHTGYIDFGSAAYVGLGSYTAGVLMVTTGLPIIPAALAAGLAAGLAGLIVGWPTLRLRGAYFAIATFALAEALKQVAEEWAGLTGGGVGLSIPHRLSDEAYYLIYLGLAVVVIGLTLVLRRTRHGFGLAAIREDEAAAARLGVNTHLVKLKTYVLTSALIGLTGSLEAGRLGYFTPENVFDVHTTIKMVIMSLLGGLGTVLGPVVGATALQLMEDFLGASLLNWYLVIIGVIIVAVIAFLPRGIIGSLAHRLQGRNKGGRG